MPAPPRPGQTDDLLRPDADVADVDDAGNGGATHLQQWSGPGVVPPGRAEAATARPIIDSTSSSLVTAAMSNSTDREAPSRSGGPITDPLDLVEASAEM